MTHQTDTIMESAVSELINNTGAVYTDDLIKRTGLTRERITIFLKANGFIKTSGHMSRRWAKNDGNLISQRN